MLYRSIAKEYGISHMTVSRFRKRFCKGDKSPVSKSGTKHKPQGHEIFCMKRISNQNPFLSGREVRDEARLNFKIFIPTANRYLRNMGLFGRISRRINYHSPKNMCRRRKFCLSVKTWNFERRQQVVFTDEVRVELESMH